MQVTGTQIGIGERRRRAAGPGGARAGTARTCASTGAAARGAGGATGAIPVRGERPREQPVRA